MDHGRPRIDVLRMKAFVLTGFDVPPRFADVPEPVVGEREILVRVQASSVNPVDAMVAAGFFRTVQEYRFPAVFGRDVAGVVERVGPGVTRYRPGDRVFGFVKREYIGDGTFAELVAVPQDHLVAPVPDAVRTVDAGALGLSGVTALECVDAVAAGPGRIVVVNGAPGGLGGFAVQLAALRGSTVIATARPGAQDEHVRRLGAAHVIDWTAGDLAAQVRAIAPDGADGLVDLVKWAPRSTRIGQGEEQAHRDFAAFCRAALRPGARAASVTNGGVPDLLGDIVCANVHSTPSAESLSRLAALAADGSVTVPIGETYAFDDLAAALDRLAAGGILGKIAVAH
jgi:NADPH:quinone reductase-like Zn-dependent oxidoreductase